MEEVMGDNKKEDMASYSKKEEKLTQMWTILRISGWTYYNFACN